MKPVLVSGSLAYDRIMDFPGLFKDHFMADKLHNINVSFLVTPPSVNYGGCAGNIAYSLALLDTPSSILENAGNDFDDYAKRLAERGIGTDTVDLHDVPTASAYIMTDKANNQICGFSEGASKEPYRKSIEASAYSLAILGTSSISTSHTLSAKAKEAGLPYLFDPGQKLSALSTEDIGALIEGARGVLLNDYELALVAEKTTWRESQLLERVEFLIVTLGTEGSRVITRNGEERVNAVPAKEVKDPTGAGDAYRAGFIAGFVRSLSLSACAKLGSVVAVHAVECYGTQNHTFTLASLKARYQDAYKEAFPLEHA